MTGEREIFEKWMLQSAYVFSLDIAKDEKGNYRNSRIHDMWVGFQVGQQSKRAEIERLKKRIDIDAELLDEYERANRNTHIAINNKNKKIEQLQAKIDEYENVEQAVFNLNYDARPISSDK